MYNAQFDEEKKYIEDIIDARKRNGEYNVASVQGMARYAYSTPRGVLDVADEPANFEGDAGAGADASPGGAFRLGPTDSEITVVRVKRESSQLKTRENKWDMHDRAIPGDGRHLGESPSLVNLVTLVKSSKQSLHRTRSSEQVEYLVPLSSWEPTNQPNLSLSPKNSSSDESVQSGRRQLPSGIDNKEGVCRVPKRGRLNFAGKLSFLFRRYVKRTSGRKVSE